MRHKSGLLLFAAAVAACTTSGSNDPPATTDAPPAPAPKPPEKGPQDDPAPVDPIDDPNATCTGSPGELYELTARKLAFNEEIPLCRFKGAVLLAVNVASHCGYTPQYAPLEQLYQKYKDKKFYVLGFPSRTFNQEFEDEKDISAFCTSEYKITFPMFAIGNVNPPDEQPVYTWLKAQPGVEGAIPWNFEKFLISREGKAVKRFVYTTAPDAAELIQAIEAELAK